MARRPRHPRPETRNPALLKLAFVDLGPSDQARALARTQADQHRDWLETYRKLRAEIALDAPDALARARLLDLGVRHEQSHVNFWEALADEGDRTHLR